MQTTDALYLSNTLANIFGRGIPNIEKDLLVKCKKLVAEIKKTVSNDADAKHALEMLESKPESEVRKILLAEELSRLDIDESELLLVAREINLKLESIQIGKYNINIDSPKGIVIGDANIIAQSVSSGRVVVGSDIVAGNKRM